MDKKKTINIEVAYALPDEQIIIPLQANDGITLEEALHLSEVIKKYPEIDVEKNKFGIFGKLAKLDAVLRDGDRVEVYRPLIADPKAVRKKRAAEGKVMKKGGGDAPAAANDAA